MQKQKSAHLHLKTEHADIDASCHAVLRQRAANFRANPEADPHFARSYQKRSISIKSTLAAKRAKKLGAKTKQLANAKKARRVQEGIEPNHGPEGHASRDFRLTSVNCGGVPGAWRSWKQWADGRVLLLQDTPWKENEWVVFAKAAKQQGYEAFKTNGLAAGRAVGGVATLVPKKLRRRFIGSIHPSCRVLFVQNFSLLNLRVLPETQEAAASQLLETMRDFQLHSQPWLLAADFNEAPAQGVVLDAAASFGGTYFGTGEPIRWEGKSELDYFLTNKPQWCQRPTLETESHVSDHIAVTISVASQDKANFHFRLKPQPAWNKPSFVTQEQWQQVLKEAWEEETHLPNTQLFSAFPAHIDVDKEWKLFMLTLSHTFRRATEKIAGRCAHPDHQQELRRLLHQPGLNNGKKVFFFQKRRDSMLMSSQRQSLAKPCRLPSKVVNWHACMNCRGCSKRPSEMIAIPSNAVVPKSKPCMTSCGLLQSAADTLR